MRDNRIRNETISRMRRVCAGVYWEKSDQKRGSETEAGAVRAAEKAGNRWNAKIFIPTPTFTIQVADLQGNNGARARPEK